jgi:hypothetical protein
MMEHLPVSLEELEVTINTWQEGLKAAMEAQPARGEGHNNGWPKGDESCNRLHVV